MRPVLRDSALLVLVAGVPVAVFANSISDAITGQRPNWLYLASCALLLTLLVLGRVVLAYRSALGEAERRLRSNQIELAQGQHIVAARVASERRHLGQLAEEANERVLFVGVVGKRSVYDDAFRRLLERPDSRGLRFRFIFLDPDCQAFSDRAHNEGESDAAWRLDLEATIARLRDYRARLGADVQVRLTREDPLWRLVMVDKNRVWLNTFLPARRGTESLQWELRYPDMDFTHGFIKYATGLWSRAKEVDIG